MKDDLPESSPASVRILIVDDHELVRKGIRALLFEIPGFEVVGEARDGQEAMTCARELQPDVILMDLRMPVMNGIEATQQIRAERPETVVLVLTGNATDKDVVSAIKAGAVGCVVKDSSTAELVRGIRRVARGESSVDSALSTRLLLELSRQREPKPIREALTERELDVLRLVAEGLRGQEVAERLSLSEKTVRTHMGHILAKLQLTNRTQAAVYAVRKGITQPASAD
jgi:NarL family two-component system response regulator LiaR